MNTGLDLTSVWKRKNVLLEWRWPWHVCFWIGYGLFRLWPYYLTVKYYNKVYLEYMLFSEILFAGVTYFTLALYRRLFYTKKYGAYFSLGAISWIVYLYARTMFQMYYLKNERGFQGNNFNDIILSNLTFPLVYFFFLTACKFFKDGYITQQFDAERKQQQLTAEINNLKSQIAPHFLFNTLNNLYGLAVQKSDKLPDLMLRLSDLLRHSLYETQKPLVPLNEEINVLQSYIKLETVRLENDLQLQFDNGVPEDSAYEIAPLILLVFIENAFKHAKSVRSAPVDIYIQTKLREDWFSLTIRNNYNTDGKNSANGIGLSNVIRRLELLYPERMHQLSMHKDENFYTVYLELKLTKTDNN